MNSSSQINSIDLNVVPENISSHDDIDLDSSQSIRFDLNQNPEDVDNSGNAKTQSRNIHRGYKKKNFTCETKRAIFQMLLRETHDGKLPFGAISKVANFFAICRKSVHRVWKEAKLSYSTNGDVSNFPSRLPERVGRKRVELNLERIKDIPFRRRTNIRSLSMALNTPKSTVHRRNKEGCIRPHSNAVKPYLTDENKKARLEFCLSMIDKGTTNAMPYFINMHDYIHIDEKWFYLSKSTQKYYLHPDETGPYRTCKSKRYSLKIMFVLAVAHPRFDPISNEYFDGKIGIWPFAYKEPAKRSSKNRKAGTLETKPILSITKEVVQSFFIEKLLPAIKEKWPSSNGRTIFIQQDSAKPHLDVNDPEFVDAATKDGFDTRLCCQPANSPDLNVLDLGFFRAIDSLQRQEAPNTIDEFIVAVKKAFDMFPIEDLNKVFLTLQSCMVEVIRNLGGNN